MNSAFFRVSKDPCTHQKDRQIRNHQTALIARSQSQNMSAALDRRTSYFLTNRPCLHLSRGRQNCRPRRHRLRRELQCRRFRAFDGSIAGNLATRHRDQPCDSEGLKRVPLKA